MLENEPNTQDIYIQERLLEQGLVKKDNPAFLSFILKAIREGDVTIEETEKLLQEVREQNQFEHLTRRGFDDFKAISEPELSNIRRLDRTPDSFGNIMGEIYKTNCAILAGRKDRVSRKTKNNHNLALLGYNLLEMGGKGAYREDGGYKGYSRPLFRTLSAGGTGIASYTGVDRGEPKDYEDVSKDFKAEHYRLDVLKMDSVLGAESKWDMICATSVFGYPTGAERDVEVPMLKKLERHLRPGGIMWFEIDPSDVYVYTLKPEDFTNLGLEYFERSDITSGKFLVSRKGQYASNEGI